MGRLVSSGNLNTKRIIKDGNRFHQINRRVQFYALSRTGDKLGLVFGKDPKRGTPGKSFESFCLYTMPDVTM